MAKSTGVTTNIAFVERVVASGAFAFGELDTGLIDKHRDVLLPPATAPIERRLSRRRWREYRAVLLDADAAALAATIAFAVGRA